MAIALHHSRAQGAALIVLLGIANHDGDGGAWPSVGTLARYARVTPRNVQKALDKLESLNEVRRHVQKGGDERVPEHQRPNRYEFLLCCPPDCDRTRHHRTRRHTHIELDLDPPSPATPGVGSDTRPPSPATPKPSLNPSTKTQEKRPLGNRARERWASTECTVRRNPRGPHERHPHQPICKHCFEKEPA